jgi:glutaconate CoA-transferase subunit B
MPWTPAEMMVVTAARRLRDEERVLVGIGLPNLAANLARLSHAPRITLIYEAGVVGARPRRLPLSIGDPCLVEGARAVIAMHELFSLYLQGGRVDVGFLEAAQVDRFGNLNSTVIGSYDRPRVRLPGSGGACDIALLARRTLIMIPHRLERFPERVDFITSPGHIARRAIPWAGGGPEAVITDLGVLEFDTTGEMYLTAVHPGVDESTIRTRTGWPLRCTTDIEQTPPPTPEELTILRALDPAGVHLRRGQ